jgi:Protein of unknown function (DUF3108)
MSAGLLLALAVGALPPVAAPYGSGERVVLRITYAHLLAGRALVRVEGAEHEGRPILQFIEEADSRGPFAWLFGFRVHDRTVALWDPQTGCSLQIDKTLREGKARRDQVVTFDPKGTAEVQDPKIAQTHFEIEPCSLDILSALFVARQRGIPEDGPLKLSVFDNGRRFVLTARVVGRERLDLPPPLGRNVPTVILEPQLEEGTGLFVKEKDGKLRVWLTDDARRIPVRMRSKVAVGSVSADLEEYHAPDSVDAPSAPASTRIK